MNYSDISEYFIDKTTELLTHLQVSNQGKIN